MKKAISLLAVFLVAAMFSASSFAAEKYVSGNIGISWFNDVTLSPTYEFEGEDFSQSFNTGSGITLLGALGCDYGDYRLEAELGYQQNDVESLTISGEEGPFDDDEFSLDMEGDISIVSLLGNAYYDIDLGGVELSLTAGVGVAQVNFDDIEYADDDDLPFIGDGVLNEHETTLAYQLGAGLGIPVSDGIMLDARYRYFATTDFTIGEANGNIESHSALLGLRVGL
ncbi:porin [Prosthecochloris sp. GSB1]|nr:outer membrane beta-barrel protein [Prosthecochloris sp. GSB1]ASQ91580.1 porin [Prosthecochloris sp. GSB1]